MTALLITASLLAAERTVVVPPADGAALKIYGPAETSLIDKPGGQALRVAVPEAGDKPWAVVAHTPVSVAAVNRDDLLVLSVRVKTDGPTGVVPVFAEAVEQVKDGSKGAAFQPTGELRTYRTSVLCPGDFEAGNFRVAIHLAQQAQTIELHEVSLESYPAGTRFEDLGIDSIQWAGKEPDAPWRAEAAERIDRLRKAPLTVTVTDPEGQPVEGAAVKVEQVRHAWRFGTFVGPTLLEDSEDGERYRQIVRERYNFLTLPAYLADWGWRNDANRVKYFRMADWARREGIPARGHLLVYPGWTATPAEWFDIPRDQTRANMEKHIPRAIRVFKERGVTEWDVTNELRYNREFMAEVGGVEVAAEWFKLARKELPEGTLFLNETIILPNGGRTETEQRIYEEQIDLLLSKGAPIDGLGMQGHFTNELTPARKIWEILNRFAKFDKPILITEFDMANDDKAAQAAYLRDFYTALFAHESVIGVVQWQFWEGDMWQPQGHHFTRDWQETALAKSYRDLVYGDWWTRAGGASDADGRFATRAFRGTQRVTVKHGDYEWTGEVEVPDGGGAVTVSVP